MKELGWFSLGAGIVVLAVVVANWSPQRRNGFSVACTRLCVNNGGVLFEYTAGPRVTKCRCTDGSLMDPE